MESDTAGRLRMDDSCVRRKRVVSVPSSHSSVAGVMSTCRDFVCAVPFRQHMHGMCAHANEFYHGTHWAIGVLHTWFGSYRRIVLCCLEW